MIDWNFIGTLEEVRLEGYIPDAGDSGVTIATGIDLGRQSPTSIAGLPDGLRARLVPYLGLRGPAAVAALHARPLSVSGAEAVLLDQMAEGSIMGPLAAKFQSQTGDVFDILPDAVQTVVVSLSYQYGAIWTRCPRYWQCVVTKDFQGIVNELEHFGDAYPTRRGSEAKYLSSHINQGAIP